MGSLIASLVLHVAIFSFLWLGFPITPSTKPLVLEAKMMYKSKHKKKRLAEPQVSESPAPKEPLREPKESSEPKAKEIAENRPSPKKASKTAPKVDYKKMLARLADGFKEEVAASIKAENELPALSFDDGNYYSQIYFLIKKSFVLPSHINGPAAKDLQAVLRLFLSKDGELANVRLEHSSGDAHFDQAVLNGTRRVNNFGAVPLALQSSLLNDGIVVELCPFTCVDRRGS